MLVSKKTGAALPTGSRPVTLRRRYTGCSKCAQPATPNPNPAIWASMILIAFKGVLKHRSTRWLDWTIEEYNLPPRILGFGE